MLRCPAGAIPFSEVVMVPVLRHSVPLRRARDKRTHPNTSANRVMNGSSVRSSRSGVTEMR